MSSQITCVGWVAKGIAKETPDKVELSQEELQRIITEAKQELGELAAEDDDEVDEGIACEENPDSNTADVAGGSKDETENGKEEDDELAEYGLDRYDEEDAATASLGDSLAGLTVFSSNEEDPYITIKD
ncbi:hypothetical protein FQN60_005679 [Etheostoma spectabile]|uniref:Periodic tryptophan protein 1 homolog n=2 Tax=Etheostoma spectabile TaxID=54343 RepID=A0A5J5CDY3_9PERO|nr:hypothetical protein FQN60_005679 [Etheostoma spectabile]